MPSHAIGPAMQHIAFSPPLLQRPTGNPPLSSRGALFNMNTIAVEAWTQDRQNSDPASSVRRATSLCDCIAKLSRCPKIHLQVDRLFLVPHRTHLEIPASMEGIRVMQHFLNPG